MTIEELNREWQAINREIVEADSRPPISVRVGPGKYTLVDRHFAWLAVCGYLSYDTKGYAYHFTVNDDGSRDYKGIHRIVVDSCGMELAEGQTPDHENRDKRDNRFANLRPATPSEQQANTQLLRNNRSGFRGVYLDRRRRSRRRRRWRAGIETNGRTIHLGAFDTPEQAALAYNAKAIELFGEFAYLNKVEI